MAHSKKFWILVSIASTASIALLWFLLYLLTPPVFLQTGNHFWGGPSLVDITGIWTCVPDPTEECEPLREDLLAAIGNDPDIRNWWPVRLEFLDL